MKRLAFLASTLLFVSACGNDDPASPSGASGAGGGSSGTGGSGASGSGGMDPGGTGGTNGSAGSTGTGGSAGSMDTGGSAGSMGTGGSAGSVSSGGTAGVAGTGGAATTPSRTGPASRTSDGVLTNHPEFQFVGTGDLAITSAYFLLMRTSSFYALLIWGDVENRGQKQLCIPLADLSVAGIDILTVIDGPAYDLSSTLTSACLPPRGKAAFSSIENEVPGTILDTPTSVLYSFTALDRPAAIPHPDEPSVLRASIGPVSGGWGVSGAIRTRARPIHNYGLDVYARDSSGLLFDDTTAYPQRLATLPANTEIPFETFAVENGIGSPIDGPFQSYEAYSSFIEGPSTSAAPEAVEMSARVEQYAQRRAERFAARYRLNEVARVLGTR